MSNPIKVSAKRGGLSAIALGAMLLSLASAARGEIRAGAGTGSVTPPVGTPSAGYGDRSGRPMTGVHDPLLATALVIDNGGKMIAFCGVDHLGMTSDMIEEIKQGVHAEPALAKCEVFVGSSHTHAGGGAFLNISGMGFILAGKFDPAARKLYIDGTIEAIVKAGRNLQPAKVGIGYGMAPRLNNYRSDWPEKVETLDDVAVIKVTKPDGSPLGVLFNYAAHPTVLSGKNMEFSADFVGYARDHTTKLLGGGVAVYFNGAQGDVSPRPPRAEGDGFARADAMGRALAKVVKETWDRTATADAIEIATAREAYIQEAHGNSRGMKISQTSHPTEINLIVFDRRQAFVTIPGELSCIYDRDLKRFAGWLGYEHLSILGLTNDAHGYIIIPEAWRHRTYESTVSFGGEMYGEITRGRVEALLHLLEPPGAFNEGKTGRPSILALPPPPGKE